VAKEEGAEYVEATQTTAADGSYPIARDLYYYTNGEPKGEIKHFIDFVLSPEGQKLVTEVGYVSIRPAS
jgi:phosphate transport system substrate-binding protein